MSRRRVRHRFLTFISALAALLWLALPVALVAILTTNSTKSSFDTPSSVVIAPEPNTADMSRPISLRLAWAPGASLIAPGWNGTVQEVLVSEGSEVANGTPLVRVDGVQRVAAATRWPITRPVSVGDTGAEVGMVNSFLQTLGYDVAADDDFSRAGLRAVRAWAETLGVEDSESIEYFDPAWIIYLPEPGVADSLDIQAGAPAPAPGTPFLSFRSHLSAAALANATAVTRDKAPDSSQGEQITPTESARDDENLIIGEHALDLAADRQWVAEGSLPLLETLVRAEERAVPATLQTPAAGGQWRIPAAALITAGGTCVLVVSEDRHIPESVSVVTVLDGVAVISGALDGKRLVIVPPNEVAECQSL